LLKDQNYDYAEKYLIISKYLNENSPEKDQLKSDMITTYRSFVMF